LKTLFVQLFLIPVGLHPDDLCFFQRSVILWRLYLPCGWPTM